MAVLSLILLPIEKDRLLSSYLKVLVKGVWSIGGVSVLASAKSAILGKSACRQIPCMTQCMWLENHCQERVLLVVYPPE